MKKIHCILKELLIPGSEQSATDKNKNNESGKKNRDLSPKKKKTNSKK
jgi:hypothetical protein